MSFGINSVTVSGNLTRDPELRSLPSGTSVCSLGIAYNHRRKDQSGGWVDEAHYFDVTVWGGQGEWIARNISKGARVVVSGRLSFRSWEQDGAKRSKVEIVANDVVTFDSGGGGGSRSAGSVPVSDPISGDVPVGATSVPAGTPDDDIPF